MSSSNPRPARGAPAFAALLCAGTAVFPLVAAAAETEIAAAAEDAVQIETVTVTGSYIKRDAVAGVGPVTVIDEEAIERSGAVSVETLLQRLPASAGFAGSQTNAYWTGNGYGTAQVNLRGLGINRTLVLLNGRRVVNGGTGANSAVDLNMIPVALIKRIEVLKDGASAIYGADAVAGVVNIITKQRLDGLEASAKYGQTTRGDGEEAAMDLAWGISSDRGSLMAAISYAETGAVNMADRAPCGLGESNGELVCTGSNATIGGRALLADGSSVNFNQTPGGDGNFYEPYSGAKHNFNSNPYLNAVNPIQRISLSSFGELLLNDDLRLFSELMYTNRQSDQIATPGSLGQYRAIRIAADHPTNPTGQSLTLQRRRLAEGGVREFFQDTDTFRTVLGLDGSFANGWHWTTALNWGRNTGTDGSTNVANLDRVDQTLNTSLCSNAAGAAIPCADYLGYGDVTQDVLDYILFTTHDTGGNEQRSLTANVGGDLFKLPAGMVGMAAGIEYRKERGWRDPDSLTVAGVANSNQQTPINGDYAAQEAFVEFVVPLLAGLPGVQSLQLNTALRYSDYDLFDSDTNYKLGLDWQMLQSLKLRANFSTAFRIPSVPELFGGVAEGNLTTSDPCSGWSGKDPSSTVYLNCQADGVPVGYTQLGNTILTTTGGNAELQPEQAETFTLGAVWTPGFVSNLTLTLDYYRITIDDAIQSIAGSTKLSVCYNAPDLSHPFCSESNFTRNPQTGEIDFLSAQPVNAASERATGIDFGALYDFSLAGLKGNASLDVTHLQDYDITPYPGGAEIHYAGYSTGGRGSYPHWRSFGSVSLGGSRWSGSYSVQWIGKSDDINANPGDIGGEIGSLTYHNVQAKYLWSKALEFSVGVDNLFDKKAPFVKSYTDANTDTMTYDLLGSRWYARIGYHW